MSIESRLARGDDPADVAKLFNRDVEEMKAMQKQLLKAPPKKKSTRKKAK